MKRCTPALLCATTLIGVMFVAMFALMPSQTLAFTDTEGTIALTASSETGNTEAVGTTSTEGQKIEFAKTPQQAQPAYAEPQREAIATTLDLNIVGADTLLNGVYANVTVPTPNLMRSSAAGATWASNTMYSSDLSKADIAATTGAVSIDTKIVDADAVGNISYANVTGEALNSDNVMMTGSKDARAAAFSPVIRAIQVVVPASAGMQYT